MTKELRRLGHRAFSCDIIECSGGHPEWHIIGDVIPLLNGNCSFHTADLKTHGQNDRWDMIIAFPPCTHLAVSGARHFKNKRMDGRQREAIEFFGTILQADCDRICVENPVNIIGGDYVKTWFGDLSEKYDLPKKPTQKIQPYQFGHPTRKTTCLWLKGLNELTETDVVEPELHQYEKKDGTTATFGAGFDMSRDENGKVISWNDPRTAKLRSKTFPGVAKAMAEQWGGKA